MLQNLGVTLYRPSNFVCVHVCVRARACVCVCVTVILPICCSPVCIVVKSKFTLFDMLGSACAMHDVGVYPPAVCIVGA